MGGGGRRDHDTVDPRGEERFGGIGAGGLAEPSRHRVDGSIDRVGDDELVDVVEGSEGVGVEGADPAEADESDAHQS